jgi:predicted ABC-type ATPase
MLLDAPDDKEFQRYLDRIEQSLYVEMAAAMQATVRIQINRTGLQGENYLSRRGADLLLHFYRRIYRDQYNAISKVETKAESRFLTNQVEYLKRRAAQKIVGISEGLRREIADLMVKMVGEGKSPQAITRELTKLGPQISRRRAATIARTEAHQAALDAVAESIKYRNIKIRSKTWWSARDNRVREDHVAAHGQNKPIDDPFEVGGALLMYPGDDSLGAGAEQIVNCRCAALFQSESPAAKVENPEQSNASELYRPPLMTPEEAVSAYGASDAIKDVQARLKAIPPTDASVEKGGYKMPDGTYTTQRKALHERIVNEVLSAAEIDRARPAPGQPPTMIVLGGRGGSGKSWLTGPDGPVDKSKFILLDADEIKALIQKAEGRKVEGWKAAIYHEESSDILELIDKQAVKLGVNVIHDATMKSAGTVGKRVELYEKENYQLEGYYMYLSPDKATNRAMGRYKTKEGDFSGRFVPPEIILGNTKNEKNFDDLSPKFRKWAIYDNSGTSPKLHQKKKR